MKPRKITKFQTCERHSWLNREARYRRAEFFVEGGPANQAGCAGGECRLWPGRDLFEESICYDELKLEWTEPEPKVLGVNPLGVTLVVV